MGALALPQALEIIFYVQKKKSNEKITRRKVRFPTYKMCVCVCVFFFPFISTSPIFKSHKFLISYSFKTI
jgi:hypothetical protein